jgi:hypothetical protein
LRQRKKIPQRFYPGKMQEIIKTQKLTGSLQMIKRG